MTTPVDGPPKDATGEPGDALAGDGALNRSLAQFEAAMRRIEASVAGLVARRTAAREASKLERKPSEATGEASADGPANAAQRAVQRELERLRRENEALRAVGAATSGETFEAFESALKRVAAEDAETAKSGG